MRSVRRLFTVLLTAFAMFASGLALQLISPLEFGFGSSPAAAAVAPVKAVKALKPPAAAKLGVSSVAKAKPDKPVKAERVREADHLRTQTSKSYVMSDGSTQLELSTDPVHYRDAKGAWKAIDTKVAAGSGDVSFENETNGFSSTFGKSSDRLVEFKAGNSSISLGAAGEPKPVEATAKGSGVTFADVFGAADVRYGVTSSSLKEEIVLDQAPAADEATTYVFDLKTRGLEARAIKGGAIGFFKKGGDKGPEYVMPAPYMYDSSKDAIASDTGQSDDVTQTLEQKGSTATLTLTADRDWLTDPAREFPVVIDPTITVVPDPSAAQDTRIYQNAPTSNYGADSSLLAGSNGSYAHRSLLKFAIPSLPAGTKIRSADLDLHFSRVFTTQTTAVPLSAFQVTKSWGELEADWESMNSAFSTDLEWNRVYVDNSELLSTSFNGPWKEFTLAGAWGGTVSSAGLANTSTDSFTWDARVPGPGNYNVSAYYMPHTSRGTPTYTISGMSDGTTATDTVNQTAGTGLTGSTIAVEKPFSPDKLAQVTMKRQPGSTATSPVADLMLFSEYARQTKTANQTDAWHSYAMGSLVQKWVDAPATNFGIMIKGRDDTAAGPNGGPYYDASEAAFGGETANRPKLVITYDEPGVTLNAPKVIHADGPELTWSPYKDPSPENADDLVGYQVWRGCVGLPSTGCADPVGDEYSPGVQQSGDPKLTLVDTVAPDVLKFPDETAEASKTYNYWVVAKTASDGALKAGRASSDVQTVTTPRQGRIMRVFESDDDPKTAPDTTLSSAKPTTVLEQVVDNHQWLQVGNSHPTNGDERALIDFDTSAIKQSVKVTGARLEMYQSSGTGTGATVDLHALTKDFSEGQATWNQASNTSPWTKPGGDYETPILGSAASGGTPTRLTFGSTGLTSKVQAWVNDSGDNHGLLLKTRDESVSQQFINIVNGESTDTLFRPRLYVEHLVKNDAETIEANQLPERFVPGTIITTPVTVTNTSDVTWPADMKLSYRWTATQNPTDITVSGDRKFSGLLPALEPGESVKIDEMPVRVPINSDTGSKRLAYDFYFDLMKPNGTWFSAAQPSPLSSNTARPARGLCAMMTNGLLCQDRIVEDPTSTQLGLEKSYTYTGEETGGGGNMVSNLYSGNLVWSYDAISNPSIGPSTFVRVAYNSQDATDPGTGYGVSVQASTLLRLGSTLSVPSGGSTANVMTFIDGDGTTHYYKLKAGSSTEYHRPAGVALDLRRDTDAGPERQWVFTRPDGTRFYFSQSTGLQTATVDRNGNTLSYVYDDEERLTSLQDSSGRTTLTLGWDGTGLKWIRDLSGRALKFKHNGTHQLTNLEDGGDFNTANETFGTATAVKSFPLAYTETSVNGNAKLKSVGDPRGATTGITYYTSIENSTYALWPKKYTDRNSSDTAFSYRVPDGSEAKELEATVTDLNGSRDSVSKFRMDGFGRTTSIIDAENQTTTMGWDNDHNVIRLEEPNGAVSKWEYDNTTGYPTKVRDALSVKKGEDGIVLQYEQLAGAPGKPTVLKTKTSAEGRASNFTYDGANGNLLTVKNGLGFGPTYEYNANGTLAKVTDARGGETTLTEYDKNGLPQTTKDPIGSFTWSTYDPRGNVIEVKDALGQLTKAQYDAFGRPTAVTSPHDGTEMRTNATAYDVNDNVKKETAPNGAETTYEYDKADNVTEKSIPDNNFTDRKLKYTYDPLGRLLEETAPEGAATPLILDDFVTKYTYDRIGQVTKVEVPFKSLLDTKTAVTTHEYDAVGNLIKTVDPNKNATTTDDFTTKMVYDLNHQVTSTEDAAGHTTKTEYDRDGLVVAEIDALGNRKRTVYDAAGQPTETHVPHTPIGAPTEDRVTKTEYDRNGNVTRVTRPSGKFEETVYDANNRPVQKKSAYDTGDTAYKTPSSTFTEYDPIGQMKRQSDPTFGTAGTQWTDYTYFPSGDIKTSTDPWKIKTSYGYNKLGKQTSRTLSADGDDATRTMAWGFYPDGSMASRTDKAAQQPVDIIDNTDTGEAVAVGAWSTLTPPNSYGGNVRYHGARAAGAEGADDTFTWKINPDVSGKFDVFVSCPVRPDFTTNARYTVNHSTGASSASVNQSTCTADEQWKKLGNYSFTAGTNKSVVLKPSTDSFVSADALKLVSTNATAERSFTYTYDANGQQTKVKDEDPDAAVDTFTTTYDGLGLARRAEELKNGTVKRGTDYTYDLNANMVSSYAHRPAGVGNADASRYTEYKWDVRNMVDTTKTGATPTSDLDTFAYTYDARGKRAALLKPNGNETKYSYHEDGLVRTMVERTSEAKGNQIVSSHSLKYNKDGDRSQDVERLDQAGSTGTLDQTSTFTYTPAQKLKSVDRSGADPGADESYVYDAAGNITSQTVGSTTTTMTYDRNRLTKSVADAGFSPTTFVHRYDALGRATTVAASMTALPDARIVERKGYDGYDRMVRQQKWNINEVHQVTKTSTFDPFDRTTTEAVQVLTAAEITKRFTYLGMADQVAVEEQKKGADPYKVSKVYSYGPGGEKLALIDTPLTGTTPPKKHYYGTNPHGDVETLTAKDTGQTTSTYRYTAYGSADKVGTTGEDAITGTTPDAEVVNPYRFSGKRIESATGSYDMGFRDYDPGLNRFSSRDMYNGALDDMAMGTDPWNSNRYAFAGGNPISKVDLDGHYAEGTFGGCFGCDGSGFAAAPQEISELDLDELGSEPSGESEPATVSDEGGADGNQAWQDSQPIPTWRETGQGVLDGLTLKATRDSCFGDSDVPCRFSLLMDATSFAGPGGIASAAARGGVRGGARGGNTGGDLTRVGRWMSDDELVKMQKSGLVQEGSGGRTFVTNPADPSAYPAGKGVFAEFNVPTNSLFPGGKPEWSFIPGPNVGTTRFGPPPTQMPLATCIVVVCRR